MIHSSRLCAVAGATYVAFGGESYIGMQMINVVVRPQGQKAFVQSIEPTLGAMQAIVGGYIECAQRVHGVFDDGVLNLFVDEDGLSKSLLPNVYYRDDHPPLVGTVLAVKSNRSGEEVGLVGDEAERVVLLVNSMRAATPADN